MAKNKRRGMVTLEYLILITVVVFPIAALVPVFYRIVLTLFYRMYSELALPIF